MSLFLRFTDDECEEMFRAANIQDNGDFDYLAFTKTIKHGSKDEWTETLLVHPAVEVFEKLQAPVKTLVCNDLTEYFVYFIFIVWFM